MSAFKNKHRNYIESIEKGADTIVLSGAAGHAGSDIMEWYRKRYSVIWAMILT